MRFSRYSVMAATILGLGLASFGSVAASAAPTIGAAAMAPVRVAMYTVTDYCDAHIWDGSATQSPPNQAFWCIVQEGPARVFGGYTGPSDGVMGVNSWKGFQTFLKKEFGYQGVIDGYPGTETYRAMQRYAAQNGYYTGVQDGVMGPNSWSGLARNIQLNFFTN